MIQNQWYCALQAKTIKRKPVGIRRLGRDLVLWRDADGQAIVAVDARPHRGAALSRGRVVKGCIQCPYHGLSFNGQGQCTRIPAYPSSTEKHRFSLHRLPTQEAYGLNWTWHGDAREVRPPLPWDDAFHFTVPDEHSTEPQEVDEDSL